MRRLLPTAGPVEDLEQAYALAQQPSLRANFVSTLDGAATGPDGLSGSISGPPDRRVFRALRATCDAVLVGAGTVAAEGYRPAAVPIVVVSGSARLDPGLPLFGDPQRRPLVVTRDDADPAAVDELAAHADVLQCGAGQVDLPRMLDELRGRGWSHLLCEGGPSLFGTLLAAGLIDEVCLTLAPRVVGGDPPRIVDHLAFFDPSTWFLTQLLEEQGFLFGRWRRTHPREG